MKLERINVKSKQSGKNRKIGKRNSRIEIIVESELHKWITTPIILFSDLALITPFCDISQQHVRKYRTRTLSMKYSIYA